jgi:hypothetical protein
MCIFDCLKRTRGWKEDPNLSLNDNLFFGSVHFCEVFFNKYRVSRHTNEHDYDDMAADCSVAVYEAVKKHIDTWDKNYRLDQYIYYRAWSVVGNWLKTYFDRKQRTPLDIPKIADNRLTSVDYDVGLDEIGSANYGQGTRYVVFKETPRSYYEKKLSDSAAQFLDYYEDCIGMGIEPVAPEDFLTNKSSLGTDLKYLKKILKENPSPRVTKKRVRASLGRDKNST